MPFLSCVVHPLSSISVEHFQGTDVFHCFRVVIQYSVDLCVHAVKDLVVLRASRVHCRPFQG